MTVDYKALIRRVFDEVWNKTDLSLVDEIFSEDFVAHVAGAPRDIAGPEQFKQFVALHGVLASELHFEVEEQIGEGDSVATRWTATMVPGSGIVNLPADDQAITVAGISIHRFADGRIVESWDNWDALTLYQALGADVFERVSVSI